MKGIFVIGTDTGAGKTIVGAALGIFLQQASRPLQVIKPFETGCLSRDGRLLPLDGSLYKTLMGLDEDIENIVPHRFVHPLAPYLAARAEGKRVNYRAAVTKVSGLIQPDRFLLLEGAGGLLVPLEGDIFNRDLVAKLDFPVLLIAPNRLGCINHSLLTLEALKQRGIATLGVILNDIDGVPAQVKDLNREYFEERLGELYWGEFPFFAAVRDFVEKMPQVMMGATVSTGEIDLIRNTLAAGMNRLKEAALTLLASPR